MSARRRLAAIVVLFLIGFAMVALADAVGAYWPLFLTPIPYAVIAWMVVREADREGDVSDVR
ncbi:MAG: hypothetical protein ACE14W_12490 [Candidatus Velamenicoccus archaeovorus]